MKNCIIKEINKMKKIDPEILEEIINYIKNDAEILIPIERFFKEDGEHLTKKEYGIVLLEFLCEELIEHFKEEK